MQCASCLTDLVSSNEIPGYSWITLIIYKKKIMNNENSYRHFSSLKFREKNMKIYRFFKYFPVTLKHLTHSPNKWYSIMKTSSRFKNNGPWFQYQCESSQSYIENIFIFFFFLKRPFFTLGCTCMVNREFGQDDKRNVCRNC